MRSLTMPVTVCFLLILGLATNLSQGLELSLERDVLLKAEEGHGQFRSYLTCRSNSQGDYVTIDSVTLTRLKQSGMMSEELLSITRESPSRVVSLDTYRANGTLKNNTAFMYVDLEESPEFGADYFVCEVAFTKSSGESGRAFSIAGPGNYTRLLKDGEGRSKQQTTRETEPSLTTTTPPAKVFSSPYTSEIWFLGEKLTKVEAKFEKLSERLEKRVSLGVDNVYRRAASLENSVMERVTSAEAAFSGRISRLEDRLASEVLSPSQSRDGGKIPGTPQALVDIERRLDGLELALGNRNMSLNAVTSHGGVSPEKQPDSCFRGMGDDVTKSYPPYVIMTHDSLKREILCDTKTLGGGWTVIQRRTSGDVDFYRDWTDYKNGFGAPSGDFWMGNEAIHNLTDKHPHELRIDMRVKGQELFAQYTSFRLEAESDNYRLRLGSYFGTVGDGSSAGLVYHNNVQFSTFDRDNDAAPSSHCAVDNHGAWWYNSCHFSNLNGKWGASDSTGVWWHTGSSNIYNTYTEIKIRRV